MIKPIATDSAIDQLAESTISKAKQLIFESVPNLKLKDKANRRRFTRLFKDQKAIAVTVTLTDEVMRVKSAKHAARLLSGAAKDASISGFGFINAIGLKGISLIGKVAPKLALCAVDTQVKLISKGIILPAEKKKLARQIKKRNRDQIRLNINVLGEAGLRGFVPTSLFSETPGVTPESLIGTEVSMMVVEIDREADRVVLSIRDAERRQRRAAEREALKALAPGVTASGRVVSVAEYGAVVDLGGLRGLIHRSELTWGRLERTEDFVTVGQEVEVLVLEVNKSKRRISLSLRQVQPDPLAVIEVGSIHSATVVRVVEYGVFARLDEGGAEGLIHLSELTELYGYRPEELVTPGEQVMVKVLEVNTDRRRMGLSVRRVLVDD